MRFTPSVAFLLGALALTIPARATEASAALQHALASAKTGDVLDVSSIGNPINLTALNVARVWTGSTMAFSDGPETIKAPGILYGDTIPVGPARLMVYHVNGSSQSLKLSVVVEPATAGGTATITLHRKVARGPLNDYGYVARKAAYDFQSVPDTPTTLTVSGPTVLDPVLETKVIPVDSNPELVEAHYDFDVADAPLKVTVVAVPSKSNTLSTYSTLSTLPTRVPGGTPYQEGRGTYLGQSDKSVTTVSPFRATSGVVHLRMANGAFDQYASGVSLDPFAGEGTSKAAPTGYDALSSVPSVDNGNYGVMYTVHLDLSATDGRRVAVLMNPRSGAIAGAVNDSDALTGAGAFYTPALALPSISSSTQGTLLGRWDPAKTPVATIRWSPPGASSLPVEWLLVPYPEPGDANGDGVVDLRDAELTLRAAYGFNTLTASQRIAADTTPEAAPDNILNVADVEWTLQRAAGLR